ncbi:MAG: 3-isopropylmalate dehydratase small subunit, partial [Clostridia bacterium]|nr:3-isopropylmalate dehydratase small subunit [Clostridia bacterium]
GLPILECEQAAEEIADGDLVFVDFVRGTITDETTNKTYQAEPFPVFVQTIIEKGGLLSAWKEEE